MRTLVWLLVVGAIAALGYALWRWRERWQEHQRASEERLTAFLAEARPAAPATPEARAAADISLPQQKLLFEAAAKAGEAGEPALSIQLYARLLARFPEGAFGAQARAALEAQKRKLVKP